MSPAPNLGTFHVEKGAALQSHGRVCSLHCTRALSIYSALWCCVRYAVSLGGLSREGFGLIDALARMDGVGSHMRSREVAPHHIALWPGSLRDGPRLYEWYLGDRPLDGLCHIVCVQGYFASQSGCTRSNCRLACDRHRRLEFASESRVLDPEMERDTCDRG